MPNFPERRSRPPTTTASGRNFSLLSKGEGVDQGLPRKVPRTSRYKGAKSRAPLFTSVVYTTGATPEEMLAAAVKARTTPAPALKEVGKAVEKVVAFGASQLRDFSWAEKNETLYSTAQPPQPWQAHVRLHYATTTLEAERATKRLKLDRGPLGFDVEWRPNFQKGVPEHPVALVQICDENTIVLAQISAMEQQLPPSIAAILTNPAVQKVGAGINGDVVKIQRDLGLTVQGAVDLTALAKQADPKGWEKSPPKELVGLSALVEKYLRRKLVKRRGIQLSNWSAPLSKAQVHYAANDCYSSWEIGHVLQQMMNATEPQERTSSSDSVEPPNAQSSGSSASTSQRHADGSTGGS
ncbi:hypothetical protein FRB99_007936 [Tulasnella sp. 403]|nr:hypothetical protein FRB99_007936 [Tulasnella sp. 403]